MNNLVSYESEESESEISLNKMNSKPSQSSVNLESEWASFEQMITDGSSNSANLPIVTTASNSISYPVITTASNAISYPVITPAYSNPSKLPIKSDISEHPSDSEETSKVANLLSLYYNKWTKLDEGNEAESSLPTTTNNAQVDNLNLYSPGRPSDSSSDSETDIWKYDLGDANISNEPVSAISKSLQSKSTLNFKTSQNGSASPGSSVSSSSSSRDSDSASRRLSSNEEEKRKPEKEDLDKTSKLNPMIARLQAIAQEPSPPKKTEDNKISIKRRSTHSRSPSPKRKCRDPHAERTKSKHSSHHHQRDHRDKESRSKHRRSHSRDRKSSTTTKHSRNERHSDRRSSRERLSHRRSDRTGKESSSNTKFESDARRRSNKRSHRSRSRSKSEKKEKGSSFEERLKAQMAQPQPDVLPSAQQAQQLQLEKDIMMMSKNFNLKGMLPMNSKLAMAAFLSKCSRAKITPQDALMQSMKAMQAKAQEITGVAVPQYYNPTAINPIRYAEQLKKRKMLWSKNKEQEKDVEEVPESKEVQWSSTSFAADSDGKMAAKFRKLMGIKADQQLANIDLSKLSEEQRQKQQELFENLDREYNFARMTTHTCRGVGLGFTSQQFFPE